ncbi:MAG: TonB-dependent receptor [Muribaculaceae bacterium]|nr:TonB-dependent receptor [Muribaculaceae bacterium]
MKKLFLLLMAVITLSLCASAQTRTVVGTVLDAADDTELIGASVVVTGQKTGASTDASGHFSLKVPADAKTLTVSYVGYKTVEVPITGGNIVVRLHSNSEVLGDVIVVAYGTATKSSFTGSAATVGAAQIEKTQVTNPLNALSGRVTGLQLSNASGAPGGSTPTIRVRGFSSVNTSGNSPLIIVDGTPFSGDINTLNTQDVESMTVLKDAASAALYGARGANGVIIITTKRAKLGEATVTVDAKWGANTRATQDYNYVKNPAQYYELYYKSLYNYATLPMEFANGDPKNNIGGLGYNPAQATAWANNQLTSSDGGGLAYNVYTVPEGQYLIGANGKLNPNATLGRMVNYKGQDFWLYPDNWLDYTYKTSLRQEYNVNITQGTEKSNIFASVSYLKNEGIVVSKSCFERFTGRISADFQAKPWLKIGANVNYSHVNLDAMDSSEGASNSTGNMFAFATSVAPIYPLFMRDGNKQIMMDAQNFPRYDYGGGLNAGLRRPVFVGSNAISDALLNVNNAVANLFTASAYAEIRFLKDFKFTSNNNVNFQDSRGTTTNNPYYGQMATQNGIVSKSHSRSTDYTFQQLLTWTRTFNQVHNVDVLAGHEYYKRQYEVLSGSRTGMFDQSNTELNGAILTNGPADSYTTMYNNEGWLFRGQYNYDNTYFLSGSYRHDASSRFHPKHRWGDFWSLGAAWIINKEDFLSNVDWINLLKLKVSYGEQGNDNIGEFRYTDTYGLINSNGMPAVTPSTKGNENITWEKNGNFNVGVEFEFFNNRLNGSIDGYYRRTSDMLMYFPLPASFGFMGYYANVGNMMNAGLEVELGGDIIRTRDFTWNISANLTWLKNKITYLPEERKLSSVEGVPGYSSSNYYYGEGEPMYTFYMPRYEGVNPKNGKPLYTWTDEEGNRTTTDDYSKADMCLVGTALAPVFGGFQTSAEYKGFDLTLMFNYQIGGKVYDSGYAALMATPTASAAGNNLHADLMNAWTPENPNSNIPRYVYNDLNTVSTSSRFLTNASYLSLENINFGYTLPKDLVKKMYLSKLRVYLTCENIWVWSKRQGLDPRQSFTGGNNNTYNAPVRTISGGLTVTF